MFLKTVNFWGIFTITRKIKIENWFFIRFSTLRIFHESGIKTEGEGFCLSLVVGSTAECGNFEFTFFPYIREEASVDIKDCHFWDGHQTRPNGASKIELSSKVAKFAGNIKKKTKIFPEWNFYFLQIIKDAHCSDRSFW